MATISGITVERAEEIADASIVSAHITGNDLFFVKGDASEINAGTVIPPAINAWPVGSIFMAATAVSPATLLGGGTWVRWGQGRVPVSQDSGQTEFDTLEETGGSKTHTLTTAQIPAHSHGVTDPGHVHSYTRQLGSVQPAAGAAQFVADNDTTTANTGSSSTGITIQNTGGGGSHPILQPYIVCYMWKRTA